MIPLFLAALLALGQPNGLDAPGFKEGARLPIVGVLKASGFDRKVFFFSDPTTLPMYVFPSSDVPNLGCFVRPFSAFHFVRNPGVKADCPGKINNVINKVGRPLGKNLALSCGNIGVKLPS